METQKLLSESYETKNLMGEYERRAHSVGISIWHFEWCTKYRYKMFRKVEYPSLASACIRRAAVMHKIKIIVLSVMPEHIHCEVELQLTMSPARALQILKGLSAKLFFEKNPKARLRYPKGRLWSKGKFAASVGFVQEDVVRNYILNQEQHHHGNPTPNEVRI